MTCVIADVFHTTICNGVGRYLPSLPAWMDRRRWGCSRPDLRVHPPWSGVPGARHVAAWISRQSQDPETVQATFQAPNTFLPRAGVWQPSIPDSITLLPSLDLKL